MGTWGMGSFENDAAFDWAYDLVDRDSPAFLTETFERAAAPYLEGPDGESIIAAAEVVLAVASGDAGGLPEELQDWVASRADMAAGPLRSMCLSALDRVFGENSELLELWSEANGEEYEVWRANVESLQRRVRAISGSSEAPPSPVPKAAPAPSKKPWWNFW